MAHPNAEVLRRGYDAFARADLEAITADWSDDVEWVIVGGPVEGTYRGTQEVLGFLGRIAELTDGTFRVEVQRILADDDCAVVVVAAEMTVGGETHSDTAVHLFDMEDGKLRRGRFFFQDPVAANEALAREAERRLANAGT